MAGKRNRLWLWLALATALCLAALLGLNLVTSPADSAEWIYTIDQLNKFLAPVLALVMLVAAGSLVKRFRLPSGRTGLVLFILACCLIAVPFFTKPYILLGWRLQYFLSFCWAASLILFGVCCFIAGSRLKSFWASVWCLTGSLALGLGVMEAFLLATAQPQDGLENASDRSSHVISGNAMPEPASWENRECGAFINPKGGKAGHMLAKFGESLFDVSYTVSDGKRLLPPQTAKAENDLLLFGCSFTFGHSLNDEQTWPWQLSHLLGPGWKMENYSMIGFGAGQMLCLLEHGLITPPEGKRRYALFLAIADHIRRNEFFSRTPHYSLSEDGNVSAGGEASHNMLFRLPSAFNGSQLAREVTNHVTGALLKNPERMIDTYIAMIRKSAEILRQKYDTEFLLLLWPDLEFLRERLRQAGITVLDARAMLPDWDTDKGNQYYVSPGIEVHPNARAAELLAQALSGYFRKLVAPRPPENQAGQQ